MRHQTLIRSLSLLSIAFVTLLWIEVTANSTLAQSQKAQPPATEVQFLSVDELKAKLTNGEPIAIIDVRGSSDLSGSDNKIKGAVYVKLRKLRSRLAMPPLKDIPKDREVVTYCSCPNDEAAVRAVQLLTDAGFKRARVLRGGWVAWKRANGPVESISKVL